MLRHLRAESGAYAEEVDWEDDSRTNELVMTEMLGEIQWLTGEVDRLRAALLAHCPNCCDIRWHHGQQR